MKAMVNYEVLNRDYHLHLAFLENGFLFAISCGLACPLKPEGINSCLFHQESVISLGAVRPGGSREQPVCGVYAGCAQGLPPLTKGRVWRMERTRGQGTAGGPGGGHWDAAQSHGQSSNWQGTLRFQSRFNQLCDSALFGPRSCPL